MIRIESATVEYNSRRILNAIDLEIEAGEFVCLVGQTGCGKSTLLRLILAEEQPTHGRVLVQDRVRSRPDPTCGYVPQKYALFPDKTVLENVTFGLECACRKLAKPLQKFRKNAAEFLAHVGLNENDGKKYPHQLSGGMQQRVAIAQALILNPPILLMDEAFSALDPGTRTGMQRLIKHLWREGGRESGTTIVFVTHNTREAVCLGTRVVALAKDPHGENGSSIALDVAVPHLDFDSDDHEVREVIREVESIHVSPVQFSNHELLQTSRA